LWEHVLPSSLLVPGVLPTIVFCGTSVFVCGGNEVALLNAADGSILWKNQMNLGGLATAAWDGANRVMIGAIGYLYPYDLRTGNMLEKINLKGTGFNTVCIAFDANKNAFYAVTRGYLFAVSGGDSNTILWKVKVPCSFCCSLLLEPQSSRIYFISVYGYIIQVDSTGKIIFNKKMNIPSLCQGVNASAMDLVGTTGSILVGVMGCFVTVDGDGNWIYCDKLKGMGVRQTYICSPTASVDPNASADAIHTFTKLQKSRNTS